MSNWTNKYKFKSKETLEAARKRGQALGKANANRKRTYSSIEVPKAQTPLQNLLKEIADEDKGRK